MLNHSIQTPETFTVPIPGSGKCEKISSAQKWQVSKLWHWASDKGSQNLIEKTPFGPPEATAKQPTPERVSTPAENEKISLESFRATIKELWYKINIANPDAIVT